jgi:hypothetical protein
VNVGFYNYYENCNKNRMFEDPSAHTVGDNLTYPFVHLFKTAVDAGINISTIDTNLLESYDKIFFFDFPKEDNLYFKQLVEAGHDNLYLFIYESEIIMPNNWDRSNYKYFKKVFTWNYEMVDNKKIFQYYFPIKVLKTNDFDLNKKNKLCAMVASNKFNYHPLELYSARFEALRWFERYHPEDFDLYGYGWEEQAKETLSTHWSTDEGIERRNARPKEDPYISYRGSVDSKIETLKNYKFSICYENARDIPGYLTEKIFDSFFAGCIPIYWGEPNIKDFIPPETFIDKRDFDSYHELYDHIKNMSHGEYVNRISAIKEFVLSDGIYPYGEENFTRIIMNEIQGKEQKQESSTSIINRLMKIFKRI